jgi:hypothetical protein
LIEGEDAHARERCQFEKAEYAFHPAPVLKRLFVRRDAGKGREDAEGFFVMRNTHHGD